MQVSDITGHWTTETFQTNTTTMLFRFDFTPSGKAATDGLVSVIYYYQPTFCEASFECENTFRSSYQWINGAIQINGTSCTPLLTPGSLSSSTTSSWTTTTAPCPACNCQLEGTVLTISDFTYNSKCTQFEATFCVAGECASATVLRQSNWATVIGRAPTNCSNRGGQCPWRGADRPTCLVCFDAPSQALP
jgi:hypothetical protein